jgi:NAD kinase
VTVALEAGSRVSIEVAPVRAELVRFQPEIDFFDLLRSKLRWGLPLIDGD